MPLRQPLTSRRRRNGATRSRYQLLNRYGVLTRESAAAENLPGGFSAIYDVLKALEESGRIRRGYFVAGLGATQFALPAAVDLLRSLRNCAAAGEAGDGAAGGHRSGESVRLSSALAGGSRHEDGDDQSPRSLTRSVGASVVLRNGELVAYLRRNNPNLQVFLPAEEPDRSNAARDLAHFLARTTLADMQRHEADHRGGLLLSHNQWSARSAPLVSRFLLDAGFHVAPLGFNLRRALPPSAEERVAPEVQ